MVTIKHPLLFTFISLLVLSGCCTSQCGHEALPPHADKLLCKQIIDQYGRRTGQFEMEYISHIMSRLQKHLAPEKQINPEVLLANTSKPLAFAVGSECIVISRRLILALENEAELAFVLAHELSHQMLGHNYAAAEEEVNATESFPLSTYKRNLELEADRYAVEIIAAGHYDPRSAVYALSKAYHAASLYDSYPNHPDLRYRMHAVEEQITASGWEPPGTINRRDFRRFRKILQQ